LIECRTATHEEIVQVLFHPEIWPNITDDRFPEPFDITPYLDDFMSIACLKDGNLIGIAIFHPFMDGEKYHINMLPGNKRSVREVISKTLSLAVHPVYIDIPDNFKALQKLAIRFGFSAISKRISDAPKGGKYYEISLFKRLSWAL
jgi:hypothetical protein